MPAPEHPKKSAPHPHPLLEVLSTRVVAAGRQTMAPRWNIPRRTLEVHDLIAVESGVGLVHIGSSAYPLRAGSWALLPAGIPHSAEQEARKPLTLRVIHFSLDSEGPPNLLRQIREPGTLQFQDRERADALFLYILEQFLLENPSAHLLANRTLDLLLTLILKDVAAESLADARLAQAVSLIQNHYHHPWTTTELGRRVGLSTDYFRERFQESLGATPSHYLRQIRLHHAKRLLRQSTMTLQELADATGWENASTFARTFKQTTGQTPGSYRKINQKASW